MAFKIKDGFRIGTKDVANNSGQILAPTIVGDATIVAAATQDGIVLAGRAGGTSSYTVTLQPTTLSASRTLTLPNATGTVALTSDIPTVNDGTLTLSIGSAGSTNTTVTIGTGTGFSANTSSNATYDIKVGPALTNLATTMTGATSGFLKKTAQDTFTLDTSTYLTSQSNDYGVVTVSDTDSGYSWSATGSATAAATGATLTIVSGSNINVDVDTTNKAVRITAASGTDVNLSVADDTTNADRYIPFLANATGAQTGFTNSDLRYNPSTGTLTLGTASGDSPVIATSSTGTATLFNANATTLSMGGAATAVNIATSATTTVTVGSASGDNTLSVRGNGTGGTASYSTNVTTGTVNLVSGVTTGTVNIATGGASTVNLGGTAGSVNVGTTSGNSTLTIRGNGTGGTATVATNVTSGTVDLFTGVTGTINIGNSAGTVTIAGNLTVNGTTTTVNSTTISVDDKNLELGSTASPSDASADGGGITLKGTTDKTFNWVDSTDAWTSSEHLAVAAGKNIQISGSSSGKATIVAAAAAGTPTLTLPTSTGTLALTSDIPTVNDGTLTLSIGSAGSTNTTVTIGTGTGFSANTSSNATYDIKVGPALTNLATTMTGATSGFLKKTAQDTYSLDTNTYLTAESDTLATVTGRGATTTTDIQLNNASLALAPSTTAKIWRKALAPAAVTANTIATVDSWATATYRSAHYVLQITQGSKYQISEVRMIHDGTTVYLTEFSVLETNSGSPIPATFTAAIATGTLTLSVTITDAATTNANLIVERTLFAV